MTTERWMHKQTMWSIYKRILFSIKIMKKWNSGTCYNMNLKKMLSETSQTQKDSIEWFLLYEVFAAKSLQSCPTLCHPTDGSPPGTPIPGIPQATTLEWAAISFSNVWKWKVKVNDDGDYLSNRHGQLMYWALSLDMLIINPHNNLFLFYKQRGWSSPRSSSCLKVNKWHLCDTKTS